MRNVIGVLLLAPLLLLMLVWCSDYALPVEICKEILEESGFMELISPLR
jgi:hypothetical protein